MNSNQLKLISAVNNSELVLRKTRSVIEDAEASIKFCKLTEKVYLSKLRAAKAALSNNRRGASV